MDSETDVLWLTHPSFRSLNSHEELHIYNYFQSVEQSGGGKIERHERVFDRKCNTTALLITFADPECELQ